MENLLLDEKYSFVNQSNKDFIIAFNKAITDAGYENNGIQPYVVFGKFKIEYSKAGLKTKKYVARIYLRGNGIALRLYCSNIDKHREYIESAPDFIKIPFINEHGKCKHCDKDGGGIGNKGRCSFKKTYTIDSMQYAKCSGENFFFNNYEIENIPNYIELLTTFYPGRKRG